MHEQMHRGNSGKIAHQQNLGGSYLNSPSVFFNEQVQNTASLLDMSGNAASHIGYDAQGHPLGPQSSHYKQVSANVQGNNMNNAFSGGNFSNNMSDIGGMMDNNDVLSMMGKQS